MKKIIEISLPNLRCLNRKSKTYNQTLGYMSVPVELLTEDGFIPGIEKEHQKKEEDEFIPSGSRTIRIV